MSSFFYKQTRPEDNALFALKNLVHLLKVKITSSTLNKTIHHPEYPSLSSLSDSLQEWRVSNMAVQLSPPHLKEIPYPAIAHIKKRDGHFVVLNQCISDIISYIDPEDGWIREPIDDFKKKWTGAALLVSKSERSGEQYYTQKKQSERLNQLRKTSVYGFSVLIVTAILMLSISSNFGIAWFVGFFLKLGGLALSILLLLTQLNATPEWLNSVCQISSKSNCKNVLQSSGAKLFGVISMSEIGVLYFSGALFAFIFSFSNKSLTALLFPLALLALPYSFYSIYYQWQVIKQWCPLCLGVLTVLWIDFFSQWYFGSPIHVAQSIDLHTSALLTIAYAIPLTLWMSIRSYFQEHSKIQGLENTLNSFRKNTAVFKALLDNAESIELRQLPHEIILGDHRAPGTITMITNPTCRPCAYAHAIMESVLQDYPGEFKLRIIFKTNLKDPANIENIVAQTVIGYAMNGKHDLAEKYLHQWFNNPDKSNIKSWTEKLSISTGDKSSNTWEILKYHQVLTRHAAISVTPAFFINGKKLSSVYNVADIRFHLKNIVAPA